MIFDAQLGLAHATPELCVDGCAYRVQTCGVLASRPAPCLPHATLVQHHLWPKRRHRHPYLSSIMGGHDGGHLVYPFPFL